jgi:hypothetical protein
MPITAKLLLAIQHGVRQIGEIAIEANGLGDRFKLCHHADLAASRAADYGGLMAHHGPTEARQLSLYAADGTYRFLKGQRNLRRGWVMWLDGVADLRLALDSFYPASVGVWLAHREGRLEIEHLRPKLERQTGMYRRARELSDATAAALVPAVCGGAVPCARRILWQLAPGVPVDSGIPVAEESAAIPLLCAAPCNHFIAECREAAKTQR